MKHIQTTANKNTTKNKQRTSKNTHTHQHDTSEKNRALHKHETHTEHQQNKSSKTHKEKQSNYKHIKYINNSQTYIPTQNMKHGQQQNKQETQRRDNRKPNNHITRDMGLSNYTKHEAHTNTTTTTTHTKPNEEKAHTH